MRLVSPQSLHLLKHSTPVAPLLLLLVDAHAGSPACLLLVEVDLVGKRIGALSGDRGDMVFVGIGEGNDLHGGGVEGLFHGTSDLSSF